MLAQPREKNAAHACAQCRVGPSPGRAAPSTLSSPNSSSCFDASIARRRHVLQQDEPLPFSLCLSPHSRFGSMEEKMNTLASASSTRRAVLSGCSTLAGGTAMCHFAQGNAHAKAGEMCWGLPGLSAVPGLWPRARADGAARARPGVWEGAALPPVCTRRDARRLARQRDVRRRSSAIRSTTSSRTPCTTSTQAALRGPRPLRRHRANGHARLSDALLAIASGTNIAPTPVSKGCCFDNHHTRLLLDVPQAARGGRRCACACVRVRARRIVCAFGRVRARLRARARLRVRVRVRTGLRAGQSSFPSRVAQLLHSPPPPPPPPPSPHR